MKSSKRRPNILFITTDQQRPKDLGIFGTPGLRTRHLDGLAKDGVCFTRAYCPSPICTPTRVSLLTGQFPSTHGAWSIGVSAEPFPGITLGDYFSHAGYRTALMGKSHFVARQDEAKHMAGNGEQPPADFFRSWRGPYVGFEEFEGSDGHTTNCVPSQHYRIWLEDKGLAPADYREWFPLMKGEDPWRDYPNGFWDIPAEHHNTTWVTERTSDFIRRQQDPDQAWFCWASYEDPHEPYVCPDPWFSDVDMSEVELFPSRQPGEFDRKPKLYGDILASNLEPYADAHALPCVYPKELENDRDRLLSRQATLGMINFLDAKIGELIDTLKETGQWEDTIVVFTSDHGEMHGHHSFWARVPRPTRIASPFHSLFPVPVCTRWASATPSPISLIFL